jgi:hypothetical protein
VFYREYGMKMIKGKVHILKLFKDCPGEGCRGVFILGERDAIDLLLPRHQEIFQPSSMEASLETVTKLVQTEVDSGSALVGPPIDTLYLDVKGPRWIAHKCKCHEKGSERPHSRMQSKAAK